MNTSYISTGIEYLDNLLGQPLIGDNLVWEVEAGTYIDQFVEKFVYHSLRNGHNVVYVSFNRSPMTMSQKFLKLPNLKNLTLLDCFTAGKGNNDRAFTRFYESNANSLVNQSIKVDNPMDISHFREVLNLLEEEQGEGALYVFDSLTGMQDIWGDETSTYRFFTYSCPRLYDLKTVAYWILEKEAHSATFRANLRHVTQVAIDLFRTENQLFLKVDKSEGRFTHDMYKPQRFELLGDEIVFHEAERKELLNIGSKIRFLRLKQGLSQKELAKEVGVTASFISQLERNIISPSIDSLVQLGQKLGVEPFYFFLSQIGEPSDRIIQRKNQRKDAALPNVKTDMVKCQSLSVSTNNRRMEPLFVTIEVNANVQNHLFTHKGDEFVFILKGELEVEIGKKKYILREGDAIYLDSVIPTAWKNVGEVSVEAIWLFSPPRD
jgi:transcriptional regulator with XRE-family HTH domain/KaiC/GvpD/RAD55 family RecA-like ATPase